MDDNLKALIEQCTTKKQAMKILKENHIDIIKDDSEEVGGFSVWIDELTRIYKPVRGKMKVQRWYKTEFKYSGIPVFFG